jgi:hypothetical protein
LINKPGRRRAQLASGFFVGQKAKSPYWLNEKRLKDYKIAMIGEKNRPGGTAETVS